MKKNKTKLGNLDQELMIEMAEFRANEEGLTAPERYHRILEVWRARRIEIPGYFENGRWV